MMKALGSGEFTSSQFFLINNPSVMGLSFLIAFVLFGEKLNGLKIAGLALATISIFLATM
jgi:hypothetical protein